MRHLLSRVFLLLSLLFPAISNAVPIYMSPSNGFPSGDYSNEWLDKRTAEIKIQKWLRLRLDQKTVGWTSDDTVLTQSNLIGRAFIAKPTGLYSEANHKSVFLKSLEVGEFLTLIGEAGEFLKLRTTDGEIGFAPKENALTSSALSQKDVLFARAGVILRSAPTPDSAEIRRSEKFARHRVIETAMIKWGRVEVPGKGSVWWPLDESSKLAPKTDWQKISASELFLNRKLFDLAASPSVPNLRFASANGIFRTLNDKQWEKIPKFADQNHPIAVAKSGRLFVGSWYSDDHGETFHSYVRFDQLVSSLKSRWNINPRRFKFLELKPVSQNGDELIVKVDIGLKKPVLAVTRNKGVTWSAL